MACTLCWSACRPRQVSAHGCDSALHGAQSTRCTVNQVHHGRRHASVPGCGAACPWHAVLCCVSRPRASSKQLSRFGGARLGVLLGARTGGFAPAWCGFGCNTTTPPYSREGPNSLHRRPHRCQRRGPAVWRGRCANAAVGCAAEALGFAQASGVHARNRFRIHACLIDSPLLRARSGLGGLCRGSRRVSPSGREARLMHPASTRRNASFFSRIALVLEALSGSLSGSLSGGAPPAVFATKAPVKQA